MAKKHEFGAKKADHEWIVNSYVFPEQLATGDYEHDEPYAVLYCACGDRITEEMTEDQIREVRAFNQLPSEQIISDDTDTPEGGE